ncbi:MAG: FKBP-type peptidyl-prolyl cis-trans isomerase [Prevotella sp.]|nr:FKBP-type peptidyl-prolyl cis-trans isomerase [Prevotella sp.]
MRQVRRNSKLRQLAKGIIRLLPFFLFSFLLFTSCSEASDDVEEFPDWQNTNTTKWNSIYAQAAEKIAAGDTSWKIIKSWNYEDTLHSENTSYIVVHVIEEGTGSGSPLYTDSVRVNYKGSLLPSTSYPNGYEFDSSWDNATSDSTTAPAQLLVSSLSDGFATALQHMHIGDEWEVYVPWTLGYGTSGSGSIPGYSVLIFDIELLSYYRAGYDVPDFKAKAQRMWVTE